MEQELNKEDYRDRMDGPMEGLSIALRNIGYRKELCPDYILVEAATERLKVMHRLLLASGITPEILKAVLE